MTRFRQIFITVMIFLLLFSAIAYGDTWTTNKNLTNNAGSSRYPSMAVDGSNVYVVWFDNTPGNYEIYFKKSDDGGTTWTNNKRLTNTAGSSEDAVMTVDGSNIYVVWEDDTPGNYEIYFKKSDDGGATWTNNKRLTWNASDSYVADIAVDGSNIYVIWGDDTSGNWEVYFKKSDDGGATWTKSKRLTWNAGNSYAQSMAVDGLNVYVLWEDDTPGNPEIYFKKSDDGGATWTKSKRLTNNEGNSYAPSIAVDGSNVYVVWANFMPSLANYEIYFKQSDDGGATWTTNKEITTNSGSSRDPAIAVDGSNIYVVWDDDTPGNWEIYFKKSDDVGTTWTTKKLTNNAGRSSFPSIAVDGPNIYVAWEDDTPGNPEIYFKKGILF
jgi:hypothetical protein